MSTSILKQTLFSADSDYLQNVLMLQDYNRSSELLEAKGIALSLVDDLISINEVPTIEQAILLHHIVKTLKKHEECYGVITKDIHNFIETQINNLSTLQ